MLQSVVGLAKSKKNTKIVKTEKKTIVYNFLDARYQM